MAQQKIFGNGIIASVLLLGKRRTTLEVDEKGILTIPSGAKANAFGMILIAPKKLRVVFAHKNIKEDRGEYSGNFLSRIRLEDYDMVATSPTQVMRLGNNVWTSWHQENTNRVDCWILKETQLDLFQIGIVTHDNGRTFRLLGEYRWRGELFSYKELGRIVGKPNNPKWGSFEVRNQILDFPKFKKLLNGTFLRPWKGKPEELDPPLDIIKPGFGRVNWYNPFGGRTGQGIVTLHDGSSAWVHGSDILDPPEPDGIKRIWRNQVVCYERIQHWGTKKEGPPKLTNVEVLRRTKPAPV